jgi:hypothetical protein
MSQITIKTTGDELWDRITGLVNGESGEIVGSPLTNGNQFYNAVFPNYGEVTWIPAECAEISES